MADLAWICAYLDKVEKDLLKDPVVATGRLDDDVKAGKEAARLEEIETMLLSILRNLESSESMLRARQLLLPKLPRGVRYANKKSIEGQFDSVEAVNRRAKELADRIRDLLIKNGILSPAQITEDLKDLIENLQHVTGLGGHGEQPLTFQEMQHGSIRPSPGMPLEMGSVPVVIFFVYLAVKAFRKKKGE